MSQYLITLSIGPVQDFIAAARKTRDLWLGSNVLSEISKAAALSFYNTDNHSLIFPTPKNPVTDLQPESSFNVGNKILALVNTEGNAKDILDYAQQAAEDRWLAIAEKAKIKATQRGITIVEKIWQQQINDVLELYGAWIEFNNEKPYKDQRETLDKLLTARKNTREFIQNPIKGDHIPKSSLDSLRENLIEIKKDNEDTRRRAGLRKGEYLDCTGVVKRLGEDPEQFTPISRIGIDPWLRGISNKEIFKEIKILLNKLVNEGLVSKVKGNDKIYDDLPYDGQLLYPFRLNAEKNDSANKKIKPLLEELDNKLKDKKLNKEYGEPLPYVAILQADGDRMGELLDTMETIDKHRNVSRKLSKFAKNVPKIVQKYFGHCIYAGGDDVLALVPLDQAITCSYQLAKAFRDEMRKIDDISDDKIPTLSVGLGISHIMTPMGKQLALARKAESLAKGNELEDDQPKNSLAVILQPRSGAEINYREKWQYDDLEPASADKILCKWIEAHLSGEVPRQVGYNLREESISLDWKDRDKDHLNLLEWETRRILNKKQITDSKETEEDWVKTICDRVKQKGMREAADELIMTYRIAQAYKQANTKCDLLPQEDKANV